MFIGSLDISYTCTGWALLEGGRGEPYLQKFGALIKPGDLIGYQGLEYPWNYRKAAFDAALGIVDVLATARDAAGFPKLDVVVVEETNPAGSGQGSRYTNKILEWVHMAFVTQMLIAMPRTQVSYVSNSEWRRTLGLKMSDQDKLNNKLIRKARKLQKAEGGKLAEICARLGATASVLIDRKMLSVTHANAVFGLDFKKVQNNEAEAICVGEAFIRGAATCDGVSKPGNRR